MFEIKVNFMVSCKPSKCDLLYGKQKIKTENSAHAKIEDLQVSVYN